MTSLPWQNIHYRLARIIRAGLFFVRRKDILMNPQTYSASHGAPPPAVLHPWVSTACQRLHISPATAYRMVATGEARVVKIKRRWLAPDTEFDRLIAAAEARTLAGRRGAAA